MFILFLHRNRWKITTVLLVCFVGFGKPGKVAAQQNTIWADSCLEHTFRAHFVPVDTLDESNIIKNFVFPNGEIIIIANLVNKTLNIPGIVQSRVMIQRVKPNGDSIWSKLIQYQGVGGSDSSFYAQSAVQLADGNIIIGMQANEFLIGGPAFVKINGNTGQVIWTRQINLSNSNLSFGFLISTIIETPDGSIMAAGVFQNNALLIKLNTDGTLNWLQQYTQATANHIGFESITDAPDYYYVVGSLDAFNLARNFILGIDKSNGAITKRWSLDSSTALAYAYSVIQYQNGLLHLMGATYNNVINSVSTEQIYFAMTTDGVVTESRKICNTLLPSTFFNYFAYWNDNFKFNSLIGMQSFYQPESDVTFYQLNPDFTTKWSFLYPFPGVDFFYQMAIAPDASIIASGQHHVVGPASNYNGVLFKTSPKGELGNCTKIPQNIVVTNRNIVFGKTIVTEAGSQLVGVSNPLIETVVLSDYTWEKTCASVTSCKMGKIQGADTICKNTVYTYFAKKEGVCSDSIIFSTNQPNITITVISDSSVTITNNGNLDFILQAKMRSNCKWLTDSLLVHTNNMPQPQITGFATVCNNAPRVLRVLPAFVSYSWNNGSADSIFLANDTGTYFVKVKDAYGCTATATTIIPLKVNASPLFLGNDTTICRYFPLVIQANNSFVKYTWSNGTSLPFIKVKQAGWYSLIAENANNCFSIDSIRITENQCKQLVLFPTAFSPNNDQRNDNYQPFVYGSILQFQMRIYNRWGIKVFETKDPRLGWNGKYLNSMQPVGNYIYTCSYQLEDEPLQNIKGSFILLR